MSVKKLVVLALLVAACKRGEQVKVDLSTPADVGRTICAIVKSGQTDLLGQVLPWDKQVAGCNDTARVTECGGPSALTFGCSSVPRGKQYPHCSETQLKKDWKAFGAAFASSGTTCTVERPESGALEEIQLVMFGAKSTVRLEKGGDGKWQVADEVLIPEIQMAVLAEKMNPPVA